MQKRFTSEQEIVDLINETRSKIQPLLARAEVYEDDLTEYKNTIGRRPLRDGVGIEVTEAEELHIKTQRKVIRHLRATASKHENHIKQLTDQLAVFRTDTMDFLGGDRSIPQRA